mgnify:CR=1 FL=1
MYKRQFNALAIADSLVNYLVNIVKLYLSVKPTLRLYSNKWTHFAEAVTAGERTRETLHKSAEDDRARDCSPAMAVGYGVDADSEEEKMQDYHTVRGIR